MQELTNSLNWQYHLYRAVELFFLDLNAEDLNTNVVAHTKDTPQRVVNYWQSIFNAKIGCEAEKTLSRAIFPLGSLPSMVHVRDITFTSLCSHHMLPVIGQAHFAYLPAHQIVGLSKIPRIIKEMSLKPTVQEELVDEITELFMKVVNPSGCGIHVRALHCCSMIRGVQDLNAYMESTSLKGSFLENQSTNQEFISSLDRSRPSFGR